MSTILKLNNKYFTFSSLYPIITILLAGSSSILAQASCLEDVAHKYQLPSRLLLSIAITESGANPLVISQVNKNGTIDIGLMQINSSWLPKLKEYGISKVDLLKPCVSIDVAGWVISQNISQYGYIWKAVGAYNSRNTKAQDLYIEKVASVYQRLESKGIMKTSKYTSKNSVNTNHFFSLQENIMGCNSNEC